MKFAIDVGSGAMIDVPSFIKIGSNVPKLLWEYSCRHTESKAISKTYFCFSK
jgi:hypothetical protein